MNTREKIAEDLSQIVSRLETNFMKKGGNGPSLVRYRLARWYQARQHDTKTSAGLYGVDALRVTD